VEHATSCSRIWSGTELTAVGDMGAVPVAVPEQGAVGKSLLWFAVELADHGVDPAVTVTERKRSVNLPLSGLLKKNCSLESGQ